MNPIKPDAQTEPAGGHQKWFFVRFVTDLSSTVYVQAEDPDEAIEVAYKSPDMPGSMSCGAFGPASVDESGDWRPVLVTDEDGEEVWSER